MKLYDAERAPSPRRVRIYLAEKAIAVERVPVDLRANEQLGGAAMAIGAEGAVEQPLHRVARDRLDPDQFHAALPIVGHGRPGRRPLAGNVVNANATVLGGGQTT
jgi:hypothetical protein